jgi:anthranilate synthase component 2
MLMIIDNYDSFTYNLYQMLGALQQDIYVVRNDALSVSELMAAKPDQLIISPGPGRPDKAGVCEELILALAGQIPILGVCLGHQAICEAYGGSIICAPTLEHGKASELRVDRDCALFAGLPKYIMAARYHSLAASPQNLPDCLRVTAKAKDGTIMAVAHKKMPKTAPLYGVQFHPESIMTPLGKNILQNFVTMRAAG